MLRSANRLAFAAAVLISFSCTTGFPMLLGEPDMQEDAGEFTKPIESSDGYFEQQQAVEPTSLGLQSASPISNQEAESVQMPEDSTINAMTPQEPAETSPQQQTAQEQPQIIESEDDEPQKVEPMQSDAVTMLSDEPILAASQAQETEQATPAVCPPASDCPEKDFETPSTTSVETPPQTPSATAEDSQPKPAVVMTSEDKPGDNFQLANNSSSP